MSFQALSWAIGQKAGGPSAKATLWSIANYANDDGCAWPSQKLIAEESEQSADSVQRRLVELAAAGLIRRVPLRFAGRRSIDFVVLPISPFFKASIDDIDHLLPRGYVVDRSYDAAADCGSADPASESETEGETLPQIAAATNPSLPQTLPQSAVDATALVRQHEPTKNLRTVEREGAREGSRGEPGGPPVDNSDPPDADLLLEAGRLHPGAAFDDRDKIVAAWSGLSAAERKEAVTRLPDWLAAAGDQGRKRLLGLPAYLAQKRWQALAPAPAKGAVMTDGRTVVGLLSRPWWWLCWRRFAGERGGHQRLRFQFEMANGGNGFAMPQGEMPSPEDEARLVRIATDSEAFAAWLRVLRGRGFILRMAIRSPYIWAPSEWPPDDKTQAMALDAPEPRDTAPRMAHMQEGTAGE